MTRGGPARDLLLQVEQIDFCYGLLQVLFGVSLEVRRAEALALLGTNGAGKSTLLRVISGLAPATSGRILFGNNDITNRPSEHLVREGLVLVQGGRSVFGDMTVAENLEMQAFTVRKRQSWLRERKSLVLDVFPRLAERRSQAAGSLSGGEQQQLALAKAMLLEPRLLCIDELSLGLSPAVVRDLLDVVRGINATGVAVLLVEQSLHIANSLCDRAIFMEKGEVRFEGLTTELLRSDDVARAVFLAEHPDRGRSNRLGKPT
ncbi:MAG: ABC transporter ATP-binding protein [Acidimicrobiales bacterium]